MDDICYMQVCVCICACVLAGLLGDSRTHGSGLRVSPPLLPATTFRSLGYRAGWGCWGVSLFCYKTGWGINPLSSMSACQTWGQYSELPKTALFLCVLWHLSMTWQCTETPLCWPLSPEEQECEWSLPRHPHPHSFTQCPKRDQAHVLVSQS